MDIRIVVDTTEPPAGRVIAPERPPVPFVGWLGLLRALSETVDVARTPPQGGQGGGPRS